MKELEYEKYILSTYPVLWLPFYRKGGDIVVSSDGYGHIGTVTGSTWGIQGRTFNGTSDYISIPSGTWISGATRITVIAWIKKTASITTAKVAVSREQAGGVSLGIGWTANKVSFWTNTGVWVSADDPNTIDSDVWYHLAGAYDGVNNSLYRNMALVDTTAQTGDIGGGTQNVTIGVKSDDLTLYIPMICGEVLVYNRALSALEIQRNYLNSRWRYQ